MTDNSREFRYTTDIFTEELANVNEILRSPDRKKKKNSTLKKIYSEKSINETRVVKVCGWFISFLRSQICIHKLSS